MKLITTTEFVSKAINVHGDVYDYNNCIYINSRTKIEIICRQHGSFWQQPNDHLKGYGCRKCNGMDTNEFINKSKIVHNNKYDYSLTNYVNNRTNVEIICNIHGIFEQSPKSHLSGHGCSLCSNTKKLTTNVFIDRAKKVHGDKYNYTNSIYVNARTKIKIGCHIHGEFEQDVKAHLKGYGCKKCNMITTEQFITKCSNIHNNKYDYSLTTYINSDTKVKIVCPAHGIFEQKAISHSIGKGCSKCKSSKGEVKIISWFKDNSIEYIHEHRFSNCKHINTLPFDFFIPSLNMCIEYDGELHFNPLRLKDKKTECNNRLEMTQYRDAIKNEYCKTNGIKLIRIPYTEFDYLDDILEFIIYQ